MNFSSNESPSDSNKLGKILDNDFFQASRTFSFSVRLSSLDWQDRANSESSRWSPWVKRLFGV